MDTDKTAHYGYTTKLGHCFYDALFGTKCHKVHRLGALIY